MGKGKSYRYRHGGGCKFPPGELPALYNAIEVNSSSGKITLEVESHLPNEWVRCVSLSPTEGLERGAEALDTGAAVKVPVVKRRSPAF